MKLNQILRQPIHIIKRHTAVVGLSLLLLTSTTFYPSDMVNDYAVSRGGRSSSVVMLTEWYVSGAPTPPSL
ncbi:hypothetical protein GGR95_003779 [Sulfitobacter undariae]|uniref:Uncharacterized protein n=1 Tax=Sulfitobacter undariae TaxID=1563671 RepID=A0A7W6E7F4_9RHOB|nr:hypothetical protein [Sulfitobacter undariae]MBB3996111.1 hypothetical protein [Sulfitobacter undariae]